MKQLLKHPNNLKILPCPPAFWFLMIPISFEWKCDTEIYCPFYRNHRDRTLTKTFKRHNWT